jgi:hypothetical protein
MTTERTGNVLKRLVCWSQRLCALCRGQRPGDILSDCNISVDLHPKVKKCNEICISLPPVPCVCLWLLTWGACEGSNAPKAHLILRVVLPYWKGKKGCPGSRARVLDVTFGFSVSRLRVHFMYLRRVFVVDHISPNRHLGLKISRSTLCLRRL